MATYHQCPFCHRKAKKSIFSSYFPLFKCNDCGCKYCNDCGGKTCPKCGSSGRFKVGEVVAKT